MTVNIHGGNEDSVLQALPVLKDQVLKWVNKDIAGGGETQQTIIAYTR